MVRNNHNGAKFYSFDLQITIIFCLKTANLTLQLINSSRLMQLQTKLQFKKQFSFSRIQINLTNLIINMSYSFLLKYIIIGDSGVGKSCLLLQYTDQRYREKHEVTIGVQFGAKVLKFKENNIKLQIWDTAGQQSFKAITRGYYRNAIGAIIVYDICNRDSFLHISKWLEEAKANGPPSLTFILVGNKNDKNAERKIPYEQGLKFAKQHEIAFLQTSAKTGDKVEQIFNVITELILNKIEDETIEVRNHPGIKIGNEKYLGIRQNYSRHIEQRSKVVIGKPNKKNKKNCCV